MRNKLKLLKKVIDYLWTDELKHFNDEYNTTNIYWDTDKEISLAIKDYKESEGHIFVAIFELNKWIDSINGMGKI
jgi:hypothetical protein